METTSPNLNPARTLTYISMPSSCASTRFATIRRNVIGTLSPYFEMSMDGEVRSECTAMCMSEMNS